MMLYFSFMVEQNDFAANAKPISGVTLRQIFKTWWPLAASWLLMAVESPLVSAIIARLPNPELNLAAFGSVSEPLRSLTSAPLIMLLAASTALSKDWIRYLKIRRFMLIAGASLTVVHFLLAFTPLYFLVVRDLLGVPAEIIPLARIGLMIMLPLPWSIGYRRFQQGIMIRHGFSNAVVVGTFVRLTTVSTTLTIGFIFSRLPGVVVGAMALTAGMFCEALYSGWRVRPILRLLPRDDRPENALSWRSFFAFYLPLVMTSLLTMIWRPIGSAAISRMPFALESLAVWPVVTGLIFLFQTLGISYNEVVVALLDKPGSSHNIRKFVWILVAAISMVFIVLVISPLANIWFSKVSALPEKLLPFANQAIWYVLPVPALAVMISWFQGSILFNGKTRGIPEAVGVFLISILVIMGLGIAINKFPGIYVGAAAYCLAISLQTAWLWHRAVPVFKKIASRDN
jgi:hypothetical protein